MKRKITLEMEELYRLCHHDFGGRSYAEAAEVVGISVRSVYRILSEMRKLAPQLFPILNKEQAAIWRLWHEKGLSCEYIAAVLSTTEDAIHSKVATIRHKLGISEPSRGDTVRMSNAQMDELEPDDITETF